MNPEGLHFLDSSALVKLYVQEPGSPRVLRLYESAPPGAIVISRITPLEVTSALVRRCGQGDFGAEELETALNLLTDDIARFGIVVLDEAILEGAMMLVRRYALRAADAIQLACAVTDRQRRQRGESLTIVSSDRELNAAASREGLTVLDPSQPE